MYGVYVPIYTALNAETLPYLRIKFNYVNDELELSDGPPTITVTLPPSVNSYYQFPPDTVFHKGKRIQLPKFIIKQMLIDEIEREEPPPPQPGDTPCHVDVRCNIADNNVRAGRAEPSLIVLHNILRDNKGMVNWNAPLVLFRPLNREHIYFLRLQLYTEQGTPVSLQPGSETTANLIFKLRQ